MAACIISTAQQASPKVIHISEPVRAQLMRSSVVVTRKPLSASLSDTSVKYASPGLTSPGLAACAVIVSAYCRLPIAYCPSSIPLQRAFAPLVDEADRQDGQEHHHRPEAEGADVLERYRPREQEGHLEVEDDEED